MGKARFLVAAGVLAGMVGLTGCLEETSVSSTGTTTGDSTLGAAAGQDTAPEGTRQAQYGEILEIRKDGEVAATLSVAEPKPVASFFNGVSTPTSGPSFATFMVSFTSQQAGLAVNPFDFFVRTPEGARVQPTFGCEPAFNAATLGVGEKFQGCLTVDVAHGNLVYTSSLFDSTSLAEWPAF
ncbi:hypothetical protein CC117_25475 [Parafrankia colletiae]|uniref:DUF4352 domain-containing protein n=1 Tax=Parafrankia colletiae TaxID=573497 RepID=A0A1S1QDK1_9ACTN|nr:hypothetical protein [Parafrankia colletiae]MCK9902144.1 hypothetical protein [Frankia sp. Cpl3]OHV31686.1 hypothetical protein CC117_25475 [Parafrankia colletiae]